MKIYINYNFCGYRWYIINDDIYKNSQAETITLDEWQYGAGTSGTIKKLMLYDSYNLAYMNVDGRLILALRHIIESNRCDENGRSLQMTYIFESDSSDSELMEKLALTYISHKKHLDEALSTIVSSTIKEVEYKLKQLVKFLESVQRAAPQGEFQFGKGEVRLLVSNWRDETIAENLNIDTRKFCKVKHNKEEFADKILISEPNTDVIGGGGNMDGGSSDSGDITDIHPNKWMCKITKRIQTFWADLQNMLQPASDFCQRHCFAIGVLSFVIGIVIGYYVLK